MYFQLFLFSFSIFYGYRSYSLWHGAWNTRSKKIVYPLCDYHRPWEEGKNKIDSEHMRVLHRFSCCFIIHVTCEQECSRHDQVTFKKKSHTDVGPSNRFEEKRFFTPTIFSMSFDNHFSWHFHTHFHFESHSKILWNFIPTNFFFNQILGIDKCFKNLYRRRL